MHSRLTSTHLVGRVAELAELELALSQAVAGQPALVLLGGDSGIGKTRLLSEFERRVSTDPDGPIFLRGEAVQTGDSELPYGPLLSALRPLVRGRHEVLRELSSGSRAQLAALLPGLEDGVPRAERDDPSAQVRLFEALLELLDLLSARRPVVLALEDVHWADRSTRAFVAYLARSLREERLLILLSYRTDELHRRHPLRTLLAELDRIERTRRLELDPLDRDELSEALTDILGERPAPGLVERLHARAEGNPLYTEELLAASLDGRGPAPQSLRDAFMLRIERLSPAAQRAARAIAVGRALQQPAIAQVTGLDAAALQDALREAVAEQVLVARDEDSLSFRHELLREALYDDLLPGERSELHFAVAQALERRAALAPEDGVELAAGIAAHYASAGDQPAALQASVRAARAAWEVHASGEAARLAERALELWPRVPDAAAVGGITQVDLLVLAARARLGAHEPNRSEQLIKRALEQLDPERDPPCYASVLAILARTQWSLNRGVEAVETARRALVLVPAERGGEERAEVLGLLARWELLRGRFRDSAHDAEEALQTARAAGDEETEGHILNTLGMAEVLLGDVEGGTARLNRAIELFQRHDDLDNATYTYANLADMLLIVGRTTEALAQAHAGLRAIPSRLRRSNSWMVMTLAELAFAAGDWATARTHLGPPPSELVGRHLIYRLLREAEMALGEGDLDRAAASVEQAQPLVASSAEPQYIGSLGVLGGELHRRRYDLPAARAAVGQALDRIELCTDDVMRVANLSAVGVRIEADIAQRARDLRERSDERDALNRARLHMDRLKAAAEEGGLVAGAWKLTGQAELARARGRSDVSLWAKAAERWREIGRPYEVALVKWRGAEAAVLAGERTVASELAAQALATARQLGSRWLADELSALARRGRLQLEPSEAGATNGEAPAATAARPVQEEDPFGLTAREREVLALIAQGATNRQIGNALFMAEKTASVHVSRILAKLSVQSRTQAAAVAHRMGLATGTGPVAAKPR